MSVFAGYPSLLKSPICIRHKKKQTHGKMFLFKPDVAADRQLLSQVLLEAVSSTKVRDHKSFLVNLRPNIL